MKANCLLVALVQKCQHWQDTRLQVRWSIKTELPHFYWHSVSKGKCYHFAAKDKHLPNWGLLWFQGRVERFYWD